MHDANPEEDMMRRLVRGLLTLVLTSVATWLAGRLTEMILGPELNDELKAGQAEHALDGQVQ